jgi:hypothetical protein
MRIAAVGGTPTAVTRLAEGEVSHRWPQFLPDGRRFLFNTQGRTDTAGVYVVSLDGGEATRLLRGIQNAMYAPPGYLLMVSPESTLVARRFDAAHGVTTGDPIPVGYSVGRDNAVYRGAFSVSDSGVLAHRASGAAARRQLIWVDRAGTTVLSLGPPEETGLSNPELVGNGGRVVVGRSIEGNFDVWLIDVGSGFASRFTVDASGDAQPVSSPDGSRIVVRSSRGGRWDLFEKPTSGVTDEQPLVVTDQDKGPQDWSRDGRYLLYATQDPKTQSDLWALPLAAARETCARCA